MNTAFTTFLLFLGASVGLQQTTTPPAQDAHHQGVNDRGDQMMGFSHDKAAHHFSLYTDGGAIEVKANDSADTATRDQIRMHFTHIVKMFADGNFNMPVLIHQQNPPGADVMTRLKDHISYKYEETPQGGRIRITTANTDALSAVHKFLLFQIKDHETGDSTAVTKGK
jgi:hypothetical protein